MLWIDKYCPKTFEEFGDDQIIQYLSKISENPPHLLLHGPTGSGKKTLAKIILKNIFGNSVNKTKIEQRSYKLPSKKIVQLNVIASDNFIQFDADETKQNDRMIIQELFKELVSGITVFSDKTFKIMVIENLSSQAQHALRRTMEKFSFGCRIILITKTLSEIVDPLKSRFLCVRVPSPSKHEIIAKIKKIEKIENFTCTDGFYDRIIECYGRNWIGILSKIQMIYLGQVSSNSTENSTKTLELTEELVSVDRDYDLVIDKIVRQLMTHQSTENFLKIRDNIYDVIGHCINPILIIKELCIRITGVCDEDIKYKVAKLAAKTEHAMVLGSKSIFHLENFIIKVGEILFNKTDDLFAETNDLELEKEL